MIYLKLFWEFFKIGLFTFGGGYAMLPLIRQTVLSNGWTTEKQMVDFIAVSESTPGPLAVNISTYIGVRTAGFWGAAAATLGVILPSFIIILLISHCYVKFQKNKMVNGAMEGLRPAVAALIATALLSVAGNVFDIGSLLTRDNLVNAVIFLAAAFLCWRKKHPIMIIAVSAVLGIVINGIL